MEQLPKSQTVFLRHKLIGQSCQLFFKKNPLKIVRGKGQYLFDERGDSFLDCINNVAHVGHCHEDVVKAGQEQMGLLNTNNRFLHDNIVICAQKIIDTMPDKLSVCFFVNSGSEANDLALRLAQIHTNNSEIIALEHAYHGHLTSLIDISHYKFNLPGGPGQKNHVHIASIPDGFRGKYRDSNHSEEELAELYSQEVQGLCQKIVEDPQKSNVCAFIAESLISCGGQVIPPKNYFKRVYEEVRKAGGVCIADEVQVGFGRIGAHFWAFQHFNVEPDIVTMGKPMGNGHPIAAVVTTKEIAESFLKTGVQYFNTYGGNPVSCAIANSVFETIEKENLREKALVVGEYLQDSCQVLAKKHEIIGDVRGLGLFVGIDLVKDRLTRQADPESAQYILERMRQEHILISVDGPENNIIKFKPPMIFTKENVDFVVATLDRVLKEIRYNNNELKSINFDKITNLKVESPSKEHRQRKAIFNDNFKSI